MPIGEITRITKMSSCRLSLCVTYEAGTKREPDEKKAKGKIKNYKLKHSRLLTCYSGLLYLLAVHNHRNTVFP
jgi:hypothetical protein